MAADKTEKLLIREIHEKISKIEYNLLGDRAANMEGLYDKVQRHDSYIKRDQQFKWTLSGAAGVVSVIATWITNKILNH